MKHCTKGVIDRHYLSATECSITPLKTSNLSHDESCCSAGNNQAAEQAGITQHSWQLSSRWSQGWHITSTIPATWGRSSFIIYSGCLRALELNSLVKFQLRGSARRDCFPILLICLYDALFNWSILYIISRLIV